MVYVVYEDGTHVVNTFDRFATDGSNRWAMLYRTGSEVIKPFLDLTFLKFWQEEDMRESEIESGVSTFMG